MTVAMRNSVKTIKIILVEEVGKEAALRIAYRLLNISRQTSFQSSVNRLIEMLNEREEAVPAPDLSKPRI